jgi:acyl-CoA synthetase (AMP-forming)/AMP-acid ligase II
MDHTWGEKWRAPEISRDTLAFLQYTSGSTSAPKGVMVTHGNILHNERMIQQGFEHTKESIVAGWLPIYHDMGLIGNVIQPLYVGAPCSLMSPTEFLQNPYSWLKLLSDTRAHTSGGPNFAYDLCVEKITPEQRQTLDLSHWQVAFNGAEPVRAQTLERFSETFAPCGFRPEAFYPCYGLAEATLFVSGRKRSQKPIRDNDPAAGVPDGAGVWAGRGDAVRAARRSPMGGYVPFKLPRLGAQGGTQNVAPAWRDRSDHRFKFGRNPLPTHFKKPTRFGFSQFHWHEISC